MQNSSRGLSEAKGKQLPTSAGSQFLQVVLRSPDGLLNHSGDLQLDTRGVSGQQEPVKHIQELHRQQLQHKIYKNTRNDRW